MHTLRFPLKTGRQKEQVLSKGFTAMGKLHNVIVKECKKRLRMLRRDPEYRALKKVYAKTDGACRREAGAAMNALVKSYGLTENSLHAFIRPWQARNRHLVSSHQAQEEASRVYAGVEKVLYGKGMPPSGILPPMPWQGLTPASPLRRPSLMKPASLKSSRRTVKDITGRSPVFPDRSSVP